MYQDTINISSITADNSPQIVPVNYTVNITPHLAPDKSLITFAADSDGVLPAGQILTVINSGSTALDWSIPNHQSWLNIFPLSGTIDAGSKATISLIIHTTHLAIGMYTDTLSILSPNADNSPRIVIITYTINSVGTPHISLDMTQLNFTAEINGTLPANQLVTISNTGTGQLNWNAAKQQSWLNIDPISGTLGAGGNSTMTIGITTTNLSAGSYTDSIIVSGGKADNSPQSIRVRYVIQKPNQPPAKFSLMKPGTSDTIKLTFPSKPLTFQWHRTIDPDLISQITYAFRFYGFQLDTTVTGLTDTILLCDIMKRLQANAQYRWYVIASDNVSSTSSDTIAVRTSSSVTPMKQDDRQIPASIILRQNYPNPFSHSTTIDILISGSSRRDSNPRHETRSLRIYNLLGREILDLSNALSESRDFYRVIVQREQLPAPGIYYYRFAAGNQIFTKMMILSQ